MYTLSPQVQVQKQMVGYVIGRSGEHINIIQTQCGVRLQFQNGTQPPPPPPPSLSRSLSLSSPPPLFLSLSMYSVCLNALKINLFLFGLQTFPVLIIVLPPSLVVQKVVREPRKWWMI